MEANSLFDLAAKTATEHNVPAVLDVVVRGLAKEPEVAADCIWLLNPSDFGLKNAVDNKLPDQPMHLQLVSSFSDSFRDRNNLSLVEEQLRHIPLETKSPDLPFLARETSIFVDDGIQDGAWISNVQWAKNEDIHSFAAHPLAFRGRLIGFLGIFSRGKITGQTFEWLRIFSDHLAVALTNSAAFKHLEEQAIEETQARELKQVIDIAPLHMFIWEADASASYGNRTALEYFGPIPPKSPMEFLDLVTHAEDVGELKSGIAQALKSGEAFEMEARMRRYDGEYHWFLYRICPLRDQKGRISRWCGTRIDIEAHKRVEEELRRRERLLRQVVDIVPQHMVLLEPDFSSSYGNQAARDYFGGVERESPAEFVRKTTHSEDFEEYYAWLGGCIRRGEASETEVRIRNHDGQYRWFLHQLRPIRDERGAIVRWCLTRVDIEDRKQANERAQRENLVLREEIDQVSMFEEIVGSSPALQPVLARISKVAPTDSTVLITGETGTGKELIARAIHKRSRRAARPFVSVNCAAIPKDLIASELFGHEKGAFTGALQRRLGRFELAEAGTIFLDEIGELPSETQVALLRVLQEREFDRVGGTRPIRADVRVIAATHRDLPKAIEAGTFRSDLYYRIHVFPIEVPPLRERKEDIRLLVEYFIDRFSAKMGKRIVRIDKHSLDGLRAYPWPGNIRELQNVIERSVIVCDGEDFSVDESWLIHETPMARPLVHELAGQEKQMIEAALARSKGRVSGHSGAAAFLGMPASTLDSKIKSLRIDKGKFKTA